MQRIMGRIGVTLAERAGEGGILARAGRAITGTRRVRVLPNDRRRVREPLLAAPPSDRALLAEVQPLAPTAVNCGASYLCGIHGAPCECCGGSRTSCPAGTTRGWYWARCCSHRRIQYYDCCGPGSCSSGCWCNNSAEPNWCQGAGGSHYRCTLSVDAGRC